MPRCGVPMARGGGQDLPARERSPRQKPPETAHERKNLPRAETFPTAKASRHGARAKGFAPRENALLGESLPTRRTSEKICPRENTPLGEGLPTQRTSERICPRENAPLGEGLPTQRTSERICPARERSPRRKPPDTAHERKDLCRAETRPSAKPSRHGARAKGFAPRGSRSPHVPTNGGRSRPTNSRKNTLRRGRTHSACGRCRVHSPKKIRLLHETQLFYGESHVGSRQIFPSFPSVGRCAARERNPVPPVAPHRGSEHRCLRRTDEMCHGFGEMVRRFGECPHGGELLPHGGNGWPLGGGRRGPGLRCSRPTFRNRRRSDEKNFRGRRCSRG